jgi:hypothetical protein
LNIKQEALLSGDVRFLVFLMQNKIKEIVINHAWLLTLLVIAGGFVLYTHGEPIKGGVENSEQLSSESFRILDSTVTPRLIDQVITIEPLP